MKKAYLVLAALFMGLMASPAFAEPAWYEGVTLDTTAVTTIAGSVLTALAVIWAIRKAIKLTNRS
jgi:hypothetical protein